MDPSLIQLVIFPFFFVLEQKSTDYHKDVSIKHTQLCHFYFIKNCKITINRFCAYFCSQMALHILKNILFTIFDYPDSKYAYRMDCYNKDIFYRIFRLFSQKNKNESHCAMKKSLFSLMPIFHDTKQYMKLSWFNEQ